MTNENNDFRYPGQETELLYTMGLFDAERNARWINASLGLVSFNQWAIITAQGLGTLDSKLIKDDEGVVLTGNPKSQFQDLTGHVFTSQLWVIGAYELVRTMSQDARDESSPLSPFFREINHLKNKINRLRVPLAKMEASQKNRGDSPIAMPGYNLVDGASWQLEEDFWITRKELSDELLALLELIKAQPLSL